MNAHQCRKQEDISTSEHIRVITFGVISSLVTDDTTCINDKDLSLLLFNSSNNKG